MPTSKSIKYQSNIGFWHIIILNTKISHYKYYKCFSFNRNNPNKFSLFNAIQHYHTELSGQSKQLIHSSVQCQLYSRVAQMSLSDTAIPHIADEKSLLLPTLCRYGGHLCQFGRRNSSIIVVNKIHSQNSSTKCLSTLEKSLPCIGKVRKT